MTDGDADEPRGWDCAHFDRETLSGGSGSRAYVARIYAELKALGADEAARTVRFAHPARRELVARSAEREYLEADVETTATGGADGD